MAKKKQVVEEEKSVMEVVDEKTSGVKAWHRKEKEREELTEKEKRDARAALRREELRRFEAVKARVHEFEQRNRSKIIVFRSRGGWWKMGGNSALIYVYRLASRMDIKPKLRTDTDFYSKFHDGVVSIRDVEALERNLRELKIFASRHEKEMIMFDLGYTISNEDMKRIRKTEEIRRQQLNQIVAPQILMPSVNVKLHRVVQLIYTKMRKSPATDRDFVTLEMSKLAKMLLADFLSMSNGAMAEKDALNRMMISLNALLVRMDIIISLNIWEAKTCLEIATELQDVKKILQRELSVQK